MNLLSFLRKPKEDIVYSAVDVHPSLEDLARGILPEEYFSAAYIDMERSGLHYSLKIDNSGIRPYMIFFSDENRREGFGDVEHIVFGPMDAFAYRRGSVNIAGSVNALREYTRRITQNDVADLVGRLQANFRRPYVSAAVYRDVPQSELERSEALRKMQRKEDPNPSFRPA